MNWWLDRRSNLLRSWSRTLRRSRGSPWDRFAGPFDPDRTTSTGNGRSSDCCRWSTPLTNPLLFLGRIKRGLIWTEIISPLFMSLFPVLNYAPYHSLMMSFCKRREKKKTLFPRSLEWCNWRTSNVAYWNAMILIHWFSSRNFTSMDEWRRKRR